MQKICRLWRFLNFPGPRGHNWGPETRIFKLICNKNPKINVFLKFEGSTLKIENFKILAIFENFLKNFGALNQNSGSTEIFV